MSSKLRQTNYREIQSNKEYCKAIDKLKEIEKFIEEYGFLSSGRDYILCVNRVFSLQKILISAELTIGSIISCCEHYCISDANILLRKYRDDMFFYLYLVVYDSEYKTGSDVQKIESIIEKWLNNELKNLYLTDILKTIGSSKGLREFVVKFNLQSKLDEVSNRLNKYTHGNGYKYYNNNILVNDNKQISKDLIQVINDIKFITIVVLFLTIICSPIQLMSTDYIDCLEFNQIPKEGLLYEVAPFIKNFIVKNSCLISKDAYEFLRDNTSMRM